MKMKVKVKYFAKIKSQDAEQLEEVYPIQVRDSETNSFRHNFAFFPKMDEALEIGS